MASRLYGSHSLADLIRAIGKLGGICTFASRTDSGSIIISKRGDPHTYTIAGATLQDATLKAFADPGLYRFLKPTNENSNRSRRPAKR